MFVRTHTGSGLRTLALWFLAAGSVVIGQETSPAERLYGGKAAATWIEALGSSDRKQAFEAADALVKLGEAGENYAILPR